MNLAELVILNQTADAGPGCPAREQNVSSSLDDARQIMVLKTCQRTVHIGSEQVFSSLGMSVDELMKGHWEVRTGRDAYGWLLEMACGLKSRVIGETEIFAQLKQCWEDFSKEHQCAAQKMRPLMQKLFSDIKEIRNEYLQGFGGSSYGSIVRKLLTNSPSGETLVIGAGQIAQEVLPYLQSSFVKVWNRQSQRAEHLQQNLAEKKVRFSLLESTTQALSHHATLAKKIIFCIPVSLDLETVLIEELTKSLAPSDFPTVIHLGGRAHELKHWPQLDKIFSLDEIFSAQEKIAHTRANQVQSAINACRLKSMSRSMCDGIAINFGWEDLISFA